MFDDYEVGYGKPPKHTRFPRGKSGNPRGRPRGSRNFLTEMRDELSGYITTKSGERISKGRALAKSIYTQALKGNIRAAKLIFEQLPEIADLAVKEREDERERAARVIREGMMELAQLGLDIKKERAAAKARGDESVETMGDEALDALEDNPTEEDAPV